LGGHVTACDQCGEVQYQYHSCRNRHCPKCQAATRAAWLAREASYLLPVPYYHVVFTLPAAVAALALANPVTLYGLLFRTAQETLRAVAADPRHLGAQVGTVAVLHTWGQNLHHHPHLHCVVTGGGLACNARGQVETPARWVACRPGFFLPVRVLSRVFRGKYLAALRQAYDAGQLRLGGSLAALVAPAGFAAWLASLYAQDWVVYAKPPFGGPEQVLKYLARYTHRVALSEQRLVALQEGQVTFTAKDYTAGGQVRRLTLPALEFLRRFVQHVLPRGFVKVRHSGLLANRGRSARLAPARWLLGVAGVREQVGASREAAPAREPRRCPVCGVGQLFVVQELPRADASPAVAGSPSADTS
jgi:hypothetical protein